MNDRNHGPKDSCWQCYKLYARAEAVVCAISNKKFCKETCLKRFTGDNILSCQLRSGARSCKTRFVKSTGIFNIGKWLCSEACVNDDDDIERFNELEAQAAKLQAENDVNEESEEGEIDL